MLTSLEWPPYTGERLQRAGATSVVVRAAFKAVGYDVDIRFYPWNRAVEEARSNGEVAGYFPEYPSEERAREFFFSDSIGKSPLGFAKRRARSISWHSHEDLPQYLIGTVSGYVNSERLDAMIAAGEVKTDESVSDVLNLRKVLAGRVDLAVVDFNVYDYLLARDPHIHARRGEIRFDPHLLAIHNLHVCFKKGPEGERLLHLFNQGLKRISVMDIQRRLIGVINQP